MIRSHSREASGTRDRLLDLLNEEGNFQFPIYCLLVYIYILIIFPDSSRIRRVLELYVQQGSERRGGQRQRSGRAEESEREGRQAGGGEGEGEDGDCEKKGYETEIQEICEKVRDTDCFNVTVTKTRKDIKKTCRTRVCLTSRLV